METTYVVLLRGINVSGQKKIKMADLRAWLETAGMQDVRTYIQSGNVVLRSALDRAALERRIHALLLEHTGWEIPVCARSKQAWADVVRTAPFAEAATDTPQYVGVVFLHKQPESSPTDGMDAAQWLPEAYHHYGEEIYLHLPNGFGRTKLTNNFWEKQAGVSATTRNWKTVLALLSMTD